MQPSVMPISFFFFFNTGAAFFIKMQQEPNPLTIMGHTSNASSKNYNYLKIFVFSDIILLLYYQNMA